jgi:hemerythrin-like domain-containing protein
MSIAALMADHHSQCDELFADTEAACFSGNWPKCGEYLVALTEGVESHFKAEEEILFPAFESASGMTSGPTEMMRVEHSQMRELLADMGTAAAQQDEALFRGNAETLLILMQQHNMKEENILYPMCERTLAGDALVEQLQARINQTCLS